MHQFISHIPATPCSTMKLKVIKPNLPQKKNRHFSNGSLTFIVEGKQLFLLIPVPHLFQGLFASVSLVSCFCLKLCQLLWDKEPCCLAL